MKTIKTGIVDIENNLNMDIVAVSRKNDDGKTYNQLFAITPKGMVDITEAVESIVLSL